MEDNKKGTRKRIVRKASPEEGGALIFLHTEMVTLVIHTDLEGTRQP